MKPWQWLGVMAAVACGGGVPSIPCVGGAGGPGGDVPGLLPLDQLPLSRSLALANPQCAGPVPTVKTEVLDPTNLSVEHTSTGVMAGFSTTLSFTPLKPGSYHLTATFEPGLGSAQLDVLVALNRQSAPGFDAAKIPEFANCDARERLSDGAELCAGPDRLRLKSANGTVTLLSADNSARVGDVLWVLTSKSIARYRVGTAFISEPADPVLINNPYVGSSASLTATENQLWAVDNAGVSKVVFANGQLSVQRASWAISLGASPVSTLSANGAVLGVAGVNAYCQINAASLGPSVCRLLTGERAVGAEAAALWFTPRAGVLNRLAPADSVDALPQSTSLVLPAGILAERFVEFAPVSQNTAPRVFPRSSSDLVYLPRFDAEQGIVLERYFSSTGDRVVSASSTQVAIEREDGSFRYVTR